MKGRARMIMFLKKSMVLCSGFVALSSLFSGMSWATSGQQIPHGSLVQMPFEMPTTPEYQAPESATPAPEQLSEQEKERLDALVPLLAGKQEFWAIPGTQHHAFFQEHNHPRSSFHLNVVFKLSLI